MPNTALLDIAFSTVAQHVLHEDFRPQMSEGEATPFDIPLNKMMPAIMSDPGVVVATRAEVHDVFHADFLRDIQRVFALSHHVDVIAREKKCSVDALQGRRNRFWVVKIETHHRDPKRSCFLS